VVLAFFQSGVIFLHRLVRGLQIYLRHKGLAEEETVYWEILKEKYERGNRQVAPATVGN
jgi:hypothetical protein